jgi:uncharacterized protein YbjT (DUF2867 family)
MLEARHTYFLVSMPLIPAYWSHAESQSTIPPPLPPGSSRHPFFEGNINMILVVGATGTNGTEIVGQLAAAGQSVRALARNPAKASGLTQPGVEVVAGDLDNADSLDKAIAGVDRAFFLASVDPRYVGWFRNFLDAAVRAGTGHVVKFSGMGADPASSSELLRQHGETDELLAHSGLAHTILRPNSFYQNMLWSAQSIKEQGAFYLPMRDASQSLVDVRDIAAVAVKVLTEHGHEGRIYEITGPESLSYHDVAARLSEVLGRTIQYVAVPPAAARQSMLQAGMPEWNVDVLIDLYEVFASGAASSVTDTVQRVTGKPPIAFDQFARDHAATFTA